MLIKALKKIKYNKGRDKSFKILKDKISCIFIKVNEMALIAFDPHLSILFDLFLLNV